MAQSQSKNKNDNSDLRTSNFSFDLANEETEEIYMRKSVH